MSDHGIHKTLIEEGSVDSLPCHEVDEVLEGALELVVGALSQIFKYMVCFVLREYDLKLLKDLLDSLVVNELVWHVLKDFEDNGLESGVLLLQAVLNLLI